MWIAARGANQEHGKVFFFYTITIDHILNYHALYCPWGFVQGCPGRPAIMTHISVLRLGLICYQEDIRFLCIKISFVLTVYFDSEAS